MKVLEEKQVGDFDTITYGVDNLRVEALKSRNAPREAEFLPSKVLDKDGKVLWKFDKHRHQGAFAWLREVDEGDYMIVYATRHQVMEVIPIRDLPNMRPVKDINGCEAYEGGRSAQEIVELKLLFAEDMWLEPSFSPAEAFVARLLQKRRAEERSRIKAEEEAQKAEAKANRERERQTRIATILARPVIYGFAPDGRRLSGIPVIEKEYEMLPDETWVMAVKSYDVEAKTYGELIEHFMVSKSTAGRVSKRHVRQVSSADPTRPKVAAMKRGELIFEIGNSLEIISLYERSGIEALHAEGLNGAAKVGLHPANPDGTITIYEVVKKGVREIGRFTPVAS